MQDGSVNLIVLSQNEIYLKISKKLKDGLSGERKKRFKNMKELANAINESEQSIVNFFWHQNAVLLRVFLKLV